MQSAGRCGCALYGINVVPGFVPMLCPSARYVHLWSFSSAASAAAHHDLLHMVPTGVEQQHLLAKAHILATGVYHHLHATCHYHQWRPCFRDIGCEAINDSDCGGVVAMAAVVALWHAMMRLYAVRMRPSPWLGPLASARCHQAKTTRNHHPHLTSPSHK